MIESEEVALGDGLALVRATTLVDAPAGLADDPHSTVAVLALESAAGDGRALETAGRRLRRLQTALRLWDDAEPSLGPTAWARTDGSAWMAVPLAAGLRRPAGDCLLSAEEEDPLRAFCGLVARRTPRAGELAWALRRFELGCERGGAVEALTDWLLAAKALFADVDCAATTASPSAWRRSAPRRPIAPRLEARVREAISLERAAMAGFVRPATRSTRSSASSAAACARCCATCSAAISTRRAAPRRRRPAASHSNRCERTSARPVDVVDVVVELGHEDRRRVAEPRRAGAARSSASRAASAASSPVATLTRSASAGPRSAATAVRQRPRRAAGGRG